MKANIWLFIGLLFLTLCSPSNSSESGTENKNSSGDENVVSATVERSDTLRNYGRSLPDILDSLHIGPDDISVEIKKLSYCLSIKADTLTLKEYPCVFGGNPVDDKRMEGDMCTPEGSFYMVTKYPHKSWSKFIWINYPTAESWQRHRASQRNGEIPAEASIGGEIGIHGVPEGMDNMIDRRINWTLGCISLKNKDVNEIYPYITASTPILILK